MKKFLSILLAVVLMLSLAVPAAAAYDGGSAYSAGGWWNKWKDYVTTNPSEPEVPTETPAEAMLDIPSISEARFYHSGSISSLRNRLQIKWNAVEDAQSYEIEVTKADGTVQNYTSTAATLMVKNASCPKVFVEGTNTWTAATVRVRAVAENAVSDWSDSVRISCDSIH